MKKILISVIGYTMLAGGLTVVGVSFVYIIGVILTISGILIAIGVVCGAFQ